jgi:hypothetical protein
MEGHAPLKANYKKSKILSCDDKFLPLTLSSIKLKDTDAAGSRYFVSAVPRFVDFRR